MPDANSIVSSLYALALGGVGGGGGAQAGGATYVTLEWPALPVDGARYGNIWATDNQGGSPEALEAFSGLVDGLPALGTMYQPSGLTLPQVYALLLEATGTSAAASHVLAAAQETFETVTRGSLESPGLNFHPSWPTPSTWCDPAGTGLWTKVAIQPNDAAKPPPPTTPPAMRALLLQPGFGKLQLLRTTAATPAVKVPLSARPLVLRGETAMLRPPDQQPNAQAVAARQASFTTAATRLVQRPTASAATGRPLSLAMRNPVLTMTPAVGPSDTPGHPIVGPRVPIDVSPRPRLGDVLLPGHIRFPPFFPIGPATPPVQTQPVAATKVGVSFDYIRVLIRRPWLDATIFRLGGWSVDGLPPGSVSTGSADANPGMMPLLPTAFIAIRNVRVSGQWSDADRQSIGGALAGGGTAALGPFTLASDGSALGGFDGSTLTLPGVFVIAWECQLLPQLPPS